MAAGFSQFNAGTATMPSYRNSDAAPPIMQGCPPPAQWRVPFPDWDRPPWNRWSFQHIRELMPTAQIRRGTGPVTTLEDDPEDVGVLKFDAADGGQMTVDHMLDATYTDGFLVHIGGRTVFERYFNAMRPDSLHLAQSVSKSVTATVAGILIGRGVLDPDRPVTDYLPELERTAWKGAKLQHVLDMTSGVKYSEEYTDPLCDIGRTDVAAGWKPVPPDARRGDFWPDCIWDQIVTLKTQEADHGARFEYRSIETDVLAHAMERMTGRRLPDLIEAELWSRIGAKHDACISVDRSGYGLAQGGFNATLRDFARFGLLHLNMGRVGGEQVVPESWVRDTRRGDHGLFNDAAREQMPNGRYRNMFWIEDANRETVMCVGVFGQLIYIAPEYDMVAVKLSSWPDFLDATHSSNTLRALHAIGKAHGPQL
jgi:CubicO group peptidase (beta-lactamase class C family)